MRKEYVQYSGKTPLLNQHWANCGKSKPKDPETFKICTILNSFFLTRDYDPISRGYITHNNYHSSSLNYRSLTGQKTNIQTKKNKQLHQIFAINTYNKQKLIKIYFMKTIKYLLCALVLVGLTACSAEDGQDGIDGMDGIDGIDGTQGPAGEDGNANVVSVFLENQSVSIGITTFMIPELTQEIYDNGLIYGYVTVNGNDFWEAMPLSTGGNIILDINRIRLGEVDLEATFSQSGLNFRFILIPATAISGRLDYSNYENVSSFYNLD